jgi:predicted transcriptional regulator YdeE
MSEKNKPSIKVFQIHQGGFSFLGNENIITESSDFGYIWNNFFDKGGYEPILPYATGDKQHINVWYNNDKGEKIYSQGLFVDNVKEIPAGYKLVNFPAYDFIVVTTEWMTTYEESVGENGNGQCNRYAKTVQIPDGYIRDDGPDSLITKIEKENADTPDGSRYEVWMPIKKI